MAHDIVNTATGKALPWHGLGTNYTPISNAAFFAMFPENAFKVETVNVRIVCRNTLASALRKPSRWERLKAWAHETAERVVHNGE